MRALMDDSRYLKRGDLDENDARGEIADSYSHENFLNIWHYMQEYVDLRRSSELARYFCRGISCPSVSVLHLVIANIINVAMYVNLGMAVRSYVLQCEEGNEGNARKALLEFYDLLPTFPEFESVSRKEFAELEGRAKGQKKQIKVKDTEALRKMYRSLGPPPPPCTARRTT